jgi:hypothetical protein
MNLTAEQPVVSPLMQQIALLNIRVNDMLSQLNVVTKVMIEENAALKREISEFKAKQVCKP